MGDAATLRQLLTGYVQENKRMPDIMKLASNCANDLEEIIKEIKDPSGCTAIHVAVQSNKNAILGYLLGPLNSGQKVNLLMAADDDGNLPIHHAALEGNGYVIQHLRQYFETNRQFMTMMASQNQSGENAMHCAMANDHASFVKPMLREAQKQDVDRWMELLECKDTEANTPIHRAAAAGCYDALKKAMNQVQPQQREDLLRIQNDRGQTPMDAATAARDAARNAAARPFNKTINILDPPEIN